MTQFSSKIQQSTSAPEKETDEKQTTIKKNCTPCLWVLWKFSKFVEVLLEAADWPASHCLTPHRVRSGEFWHAQQGPSMTQDQE